MTHEERRQRLVLEMDCAAYMCAGILRGAVLTGHMKEPLAVAAAARMEIAMAALDAEDAVERIRQKAPA